jgi:putative transposase
MPRLLRALWVFLASATDRELARMVEYLKEENRILRSKLPERITVTPQERARLVKLSRAVGTAIRELVTIVSPRTFARWVAGTKGTGAKSGRAAPTAKPGRPRTESEIRELIVRLGRENQWGYTRVLGELRKLGVHTVSRSTVANVLRESGLDPGSKRGEGSWTEFVTRHAATLWASDFVSARTLTSAGVVDLYLLFFTHVGSRRVVVSNPTAHPDAAWVAQQARNATMEVADLGLTATHLLIDHDAKFTGAFDAVWDAEGCEVRRVGPRAPNMNAYAERWVQSLRVECLDQLVIVGERHLRHLVREFVEHYNAERPHQSRGNVPLPEAERADAGEPAILPFPSSAVKCRERLGGALKHDYRAAA